MMTRIAATPITRTVICIHNFSIHIISAKLAKKPDFIHTQKGMNAVKAGINDTEAYSDFKFTKKDWIENACKVKNTQKHSFINIC